MIGLAFATLLPGATGVLKAPAGGVRCFTVFELTLGAIWPGTNPYVDGPSVSATFQGTAGPARGKTYVVRRRLVVLRNLLRRSRPGRDRRPPHGDCALLAANPLYHGFLERDGYACRPTDGTLFLPVGDSQFSFSEEFTLEE